MFRIKQIKPILSVLLFLHFCASAHAKHATLDLSRLVVVGDSLSAGVQNIGLVDFQQKTGYVEVLAQQAGIDKQMILPLIAPPGMPPILEMQKQGLIPEIGVRSPLTLQYDLLHPQRTNPEVQPTNLSVPGFTVRQALQFRPTTLRVPPGPEQWGDLILGYPSPFGNGGQSRTMVEQAVMLKPTTTLVWLGNNDALIGAMVGVLQMITPPAQFEADFKAILDQLCGKTGANQQCSSDSQLITATLPDVTTIPFFTPAQEVARMFAVPMDRLARQVGITNGDFVRRSALPVIQKILNGEASGPLGVCKSPIYALPVATVPCVFSAADAAFVQSNITAYNAAIIRQSAAHDAFVLDTHGLLVNLKDKGYKIRNLRLTTAYLGGLFSLDGVHPSKTGYAVLANFIIDQLNHEFKLKIPNASVEDVWNSDPLQKLSVVFQGDHSDDSPGQN